ncbi:MAG TPA: protease pro-enzyme activation domain-containing protein [Acidimicrobiales bacterium]|nr:protease pro-enzyme activation domain-containing protein [Acidimicrobiales bacterium]
MRPPSRPFRWLSAALAAGTLALAFPVANAYPISSRVVVASATRLSVGDAVVRQSVTSNFDLVMRLSHQSELTGFLASLYDSASANYHHFLAPRDFARRFGASSASVATVESYFTNYGLRIVSLNRAHTILSLRGSSNEIARAFATPVETVRTASGSLTSQFARRATVPASIAKIVAHAVGLSSTVTATPQLRQPLVQPNASSSTASHVASHVVSSPSTCPSAVSAQSLHGGFTAQQEAQLYGLDSAWAAGNTGVGQTVAVYELAQFSQSDLNTYFSCYGVSPSVSSVNVDGGPGLGAVGAEEATLDVEEIGALAPSANLEVYQGPNSSSGPLDVYARIADDNTANVVSVSWGTCETDPSGDPTGEQVVFQQMAAQGQSVLASAGDSGSSDCNGNSSNSISLAVDDPASQPFVTGVGGLNVQSISPLVQSVWNQQVPASNACATSGGTGGGQSVVWSRPNWQVTPGSSVSSTMRMVPDLSVIGDPATGFIMYFSGSNPNSQCPQVSWTPIGGTSIGSPLVSALVAVATQACSQGRLGFLNPQLYQMPASDFVDVTNGSNDVFGAGGYSAAAGYDMASGLGSPNGASFLSGLCPNFSYDATKSSFAKSPGDPRAVSGSANVSTTLLNVNGAVLANQSVGVVASTSFGRLTINNEASSTTSTGASAQITTDANGSASATISDSRAGTVNVDLVYRGATIYSTSFNFVDTSAAVTRPGAPRIASLVALPSGFALRVVPPSNNGGGAITRYQYALNGTSNWVSFRSTSLTVLGLAQGRAYYVRVRAFNAVGASPASASKRVVTKT